MSDSTMKQKSDELVSDAIDSDAELQAIRGVLASLVPLKRDGRTRVLDYVLRRLGMSEEPVPRGASGTTSVTSSADAYVAVPTGEGSSPSMDIRSLTRQKAPGSASQMAALVAYYLTEVAPEAYRKQAINAEDIKKYFKQAPFHLPSSPSMTLVHAKNAGYLESVGTGQYRLNPVGYNLVAHGLPAESGKRGAVKRAKRKKASRKG